MRKIAMLTIVIVTLAGTLALVSTPEYDRNDVFYGTQEHQNQVSDWCEVGFKYEPVATPFVVPAPAAGTTWTLLVLKAGSGADENTTFGYPTPGQSYYHGTGKDISHAILCYEQQTTTTTIVVTTTTVPDTTTTTVSDTTTTTVPDTTTTTRVTTTTTTEPETTTTTTLGTTTTTTQAVTTTTTCQPAPCK